MNEDTKPNTNELIDQTPVGISNLGFILGTVFLLIAITATFLQSGDHLGVLDAGCSAGGGCDQAANSAWGKLPWLDWPVAFLGLAYFTSLLFAWVAAKSAGGVPSTVKNIVRLGAVLSVMFIVVMAYGKYFCWYCATIHLANFGFLAVIELSQVNKCATKRALGWATAAFVTISALQLGAIAKVKQETQARADESTREIIEAADDERLNEFTGRYTFGPADAPIRIVVFSDYSCQNCATIEHELGILLARRNDISVSPKHYPFCTDCNSHIERNMHPFSCRTARAAEAAGILGGTEAFEEMHKWLFLKRGKFRNDQLQEIVAKLNLNYNEFIRLMNGTETLALVQEDIEEAVSLGLTYTPLIFINGVELRGSASPGTVMRAVAKIAKTNPTNADSTTDRPISAHERYLQQWRIQPAKRLPTDNTSWAIGADNPSVTITFWGDYLESNTREADGILREITNSRNDVKYVFRHFPANTDCNPVVTKTINPMACRASMAAEAAGKLVGVRGYWAMHEWLMGLEDTLSDNLLRSAAKNIGIDPDKLLDEMESTEISEALREDVSAAQRLNARAIPWIYVNGKSVPNWRLKGFDILAEIIQEAASGQ